MASLTVHKMALRNVIALVTGGASGLGRATVERIVEQGGKAVIVDLPSAKGDEVAAALDGAAVFSPADVRRSSKNTTEFASFLLQLPTFSRSQARSRLRRHSQRLNLYTEGV